MFHQLDEEFNCVNFGIPSIDHCFHEERYGEDPEKIARRRQQQCESIIAPGLGGEGRREGAREGTGMFSSVT